MTYFLAGSLVQTNSRADLDFLKGCLSLAKSRKGSGNDAAAFPAISAALALGIMGKNDAAQALRDVADSGIAGYEEIAKAARWIQQNLGDHLKTGHS